MDFDDPLGIYLTNYLKKTIIGYRTRSNCLQKVVHKTGEFLGSKIADKIVKTKPVEGMIIQPERRRNIERIKTSIIKTKYYKIPKLLNDSTVSKYVTRK